MKRTIPLLITALAGFVLILAFFVPAYQKWGESAAVWFDILAAIAFILGGGNLLKIQLKKISDRSPGWGYAAVTLVTFVITLFVGLLKIGVSPAPNSEFYGETFSELGIGDLPEYSVAGEMAVRADGLPLPATVRDQFSAREGRLFFRGWLQPEQFADLIDYQDDLKWRATIEELNEVAQPPSEAGPVRYYRTHRALSFEGVMTTGQREVLRGLLTETPAASQAVDALYERTQQTRGIPESYVRLGLPSEQAGPMTSAERQRLSLLGAGHEAYRVLSGEERASLLNSLDQAGRPLNDTQREIFERVLTTSWTAESLIEAVQVAGVPEPTPKSYRELYAEQQAGVFPLERNHPPGESLSLNDAQQELLRRFAASPEMSIDELLSGLMMAGPISEAMMSAVEEFLGIQPTVAEKKFELWREVSKVGTLSGEQSALLLAEYREQHARRMAVDEIFFASQQTKYPWSGEYTQEGRPFWWIYQYLFEPLLTTTFAMLAFYVASAAFRAFRAKNLEAVLLLGTAFIILLGRTFAGYLLTAWIPDELSALKIDELSVYIMKIVNTGGNRAILIGIALGIASTSLKVLLGIDRSYLGSSDD